MKKTLIGLAVALALLLGSSGVHAQNLIVNGGFETNGGAGTFPNSWVEGGAANNTAVQGPGFAGLSPNSGNWFLALGSVGGDTTASQTVTTTAGASYHLQFFYITDGGQPEDINVLWNGNNIYSEVNSAAHGWVQHDIFVTGTGSDTLTFGARNDPTWSGLDDVSLFAVGVPEPTTWALLAGLGIVSVGYVTRKRRAKLRMIDARL